MSDTLKYDVTVIGGGLAGLGVCIQLAKAGYKVALFEKEQYPFHKVCGEYISLESKPFLEALGIPIKAMNLPLIKKLIVTAPNGNTLEHPLPLGGFGISRFTLDNALKKVAADIGVDIYESCRVTNVVFINNQFELKTSKGMFESVICCGSYGKRSSLDIKWKRDFITMRNSKLNNYVGVKYHIKTNFPADTIALHNFKYGYCGISKIEDDKYCLCYLTRAKNLKQCNNSIEEMEKHILFQNKHLRKIFEDGEKLYEAPLTISQVSFSRKTQLENHVLMLGDAAGMITPLCGNGMSMALHSSKIATHYIDAFLKNEIPRAKMESDYIKEWRSLFEKRLFTGRTIQRFFGRKWLTNIFIWFMKRAPAITTKLIRQTHGAPF
ncbi:MAG: NAD(P)/FAD-dependent oxidoreductase [Ferruginibacter sp.]